MTWATATYRDWIGETSGEALHLINDEVSNVCKGDEPSDALLFSILVMTVKPFDASLRAKGKEEHIVQPFRLRQTRQGWEQNFVELHTCELHHQGLFALVERRDGLAALQNRA